MGPGDISRRASRVAAGKLLLAAAAALATVALTTTPALAAQGGPCPNEQLRSESAVNPATGKPYSTALPDCRAYELVTPAAGDHGGLNAGVRAVSGDGSTVAYGTTVAFGESAGSPALSLFEAQRDPSGWATTARNAPAALTKNTSLATVPVSADATRMLFKFGSEEGAGEAIELFIGEPEGAFVPTVPAPSVTRTAFQGASPDFGTIVLYNGPLTSLYEITDAGSPSPQLARLGVNEAGGVISECATYLGSSSGGGTIISGSTMGGSNFHAVSEDGDTVFFTAVGHSSRSTDGTCTAAAPEVDELYAQVDATKAVDISEPTAADCSACQTSAPFQKNAIFQGASADGSKVFFTTEQELLPGQKGENLYEYDFDGEAGHRVVLVSGDSTSPEVQGVTRISEDGSHVYFVAHALLTGESNGEGQQAHAGAENLYVFDSETGLTRFVAMLCSAAQASGTVSDPACPATLSSTINDSALWGADVERLAQATPDGQYLVFDSYGDLTPDKTSTAQAVYLYDAATGALVRASIGQDGFDNDGNNDAYNATIPGPRHTVEEDPAEDTSDLGSVSEDGNYVFFDSSEALTEGAVAGVEHVYEYREGQVYLISDGQDQGGAKFDRATLSGSDVFFSSDEALVGQDESPGAQSIYDARIDGGFPAPPTPVALCSQECQGPLSAPPLSQPPASQTLTGATNVSPSIAITPPSTQAKAKAKPLTRAQKLARALEKCQARHNKKKRATCEKQARGRYGPVKKAKKKHSSRSTHKTTGKTGRAHAGSKEAK